MVMMNGFDFVGESEEKIKEARKMFDDELDFDIVLRNVLIQFLIYGDAYMELVKKGGKITELHPLETTEISLKYDPNGNVTEYIQKPFYMQGITGSLPKWKPEEVIYFRVRADSQGL
jgi:hypothetical protein